MPKFLQGIYEYSATVRQTCQPGVRHQIWAKLWISAGEPGFAALHKNRMAHHDNQIVPQMPALR
jgi:hypothetical protein